MSINENNLSPVQLNLKPNQRVIIVNGRVMPVGVGGSSTTEEAAEATGFYGVLTREGLTSVMDITAADLETLASLDNISGSVKLSEVPAGSWIVIALESPDIKGYRDNGLGTAVPFSENNGTVGSGANGSALAIGNRTYYIYGEFNIVTGSVILYVE